MRKKIDKALSLKEVENNLNELVIAFNRNAEINIRLFEDKKVVMEHLIKKANEVLKQYQFLNSKKSFFEQKKSSSVEEEKNEKIFSQKLQKKNKKTTKIVVEKNKKNFLPKKKLQTDREKIFFLMRCDFSDREIAKKLNLPLSEVKLVIGVEKNCSEKKMVSRKKNDLQKSFFV